MHSLWLKAVIPPSGRFNDSFIREAETDPNLFKSTVKTRKDFKGLALCAVYKDKWLDKTCLWATKTLMTPVFTPSSKEKDEHCHDITVKAVPALEKFRPHTFSSVRAICGALSSQALPKLKVVNLCTLLQIFIIEFYHIIIWLPLR